MMHQAMVMSLFRGVFFTSLLTFSLMVYVKDSHAEKPQTEQAWNIDRLMVLLAETKTGHAAFVERKSIAMLDQPVESSGELFYTAPHYLEKRTLKPKAESMVLDKDKLIVEQRGKKHTLSLQSYPEVAAFIDSIRGTLAGDKKALQRSYKLSLEGNEKDWQLVLLPLENKMQKIVEAINIHGSGNQLQTILIEQADGDSSLMTITPL